MITPMVAYFSTVWMGEANPLWPHIILLSVSIVAAFAVGAGILLETPNYSPALHKVATWLVLGGIALESTCTVLLFVFDERISARQESTIAAQNEVIISLQKKLAARSLNDEQISSIAERLKQFAPQTYQIIPYWKNPESLALANQISSGLTKAGWTLQNPERFTTLVGVLTGVIINIDKGASESTQKAGADLLAALRESDIAAEAEETSNNPPSQRIDMQIGIKP